MAKITNGEIKEAAINLVRTTKEHFKQLRYEMGIETDWKKAESVYYSRYRENQFTTGTLFTHVERIVPKMDKAIFPPDGEWFEARPKDVNNELQQTEADRATRLLTRQSDEINLRSKLIPVYRSLGIYGTSFVKYFWNRQEKEVYKRIDGERVKDYEVTFDNPDFYSPSVWDVYIDPKDENLEGALVEELISDYSDLYAKRIHEDDEGDEIGIYDPKELVTLKDHFITINPDGDKEDSDIIKGVGEHRWSPNDQKVIVDHYWGPVPKWFLTRKNEDKETGEMIQNAYIVVGGSPKGSALLLLIDNPFDHQSKPFLKSTYIKCPGKAYGIGIINPTSIYLSDAYDVTILQGIKNRSFNLKTKWKVDRNANIHKDQLIDSDGAIIETDDMNGLEPIVAPDMTATIAAHAQILKNDLEQNTGALPFLAGIPAGRSLERTAEGVATLTAGGLERFELVITGFEQDVLIPLIVGFWKLNQQFLPEGRDIRETGTSIVRVIPEDIPFDDFNIIFVGIREIADKNFKVGALNIMMQSPLIQLLVQTGQLNMKPAAFRLLKLLGQGDLINEMDISQENMMEQSPEGEAQLLMAGRKVKVDLDDNHEAYIQVYQQILSQAGLPDNVRQNTIEAMNKRTQAMDIINLINQREGSIQSEQPSREV